MLGTIAHHVLELLARAKKNGHYKLQDKYTDPDYLLEVCWAKYVRENKEGYALTPEDKEFCRTQVNTVLKDKIYNPLEMDIVATELQFEIEIRRKGFDFIGTDGLRRWRKIRGTIDLVTKSDSDTLEVVDYKTGERKDWITGEEDGLDKIKKKIQFRVYDVAIKTLFPQYKYRIFTMYFTRSGGPFPISYEPHEFDESLDLLRRHFLEISKDEHPARLKDNPARREAEAWKCLHVCQFGKIIHVYADDEGNMVEQVYKQKEMPPAEISIGGKSYYYAMNTQESQCDKYYRVNKRYGMGRAAEIIKAEQSGGEASRRNDYSRDSIIRGVID